MSGDSTIQCKHISFPSILVLFLFGCFFFFFLIPENSSTTLTVYQSRNTRVILGLFHLTPHMHSTPYLQGVHSFPLSNPTATALAQILFHLPDCLLVLIFNLFLPMALCLHNGFVTLGNPNDNLILFSCNHLLSSSTSTTITEHCNANIFWTKTITVFLRKQTNKHVDKLYPPILARHGFQWPCQWTIQEDLGTADANLGIVMKKSALRENHSFFYPSQHIHSSWDLVWP